MKKIHLAQGYVAFVDDEDYEKASRIKWSPQVDKNGRVYARSNYDAVGNRKRWYLHRFILGVTDAKIDVDHRDRNGLNCQRRNLRTATRTLNNGNATLRADNRSGHKGVCWSTRDGEWMAYITFNKKRIYLGRFSNLARAVKARNKKSLELFGEFHRLC